MTSYITDFLKQNGFGNPNDPMNCPFAPLKSQNENPDNQSENETNQKACFYKNPLFLTFVFLVFLSMTGLNLYLTNFFVKYIFVNLCLVMIFGIVFRGLDNGVYHLNYLHCKITNVCKNGIQQTFDYGITKWKTSRFNQNQNQNQNLDNPPKQD